MLFWNGNGAGMGMRTAAGLRDSRANNGGKIPRVP